MNKIKFDQTITLAFAVSDRKKSINWYEKHLGFSLIFDAPEIGWAEMATNVDGVSVGFGDTGEAKPEGCVPVLGVADINQARQVLEDQGVRFDGETITHDGMVKLATFYDPDNNAWMLSQNLMEPKSST
ncbi:MAG: VOC family protein [Robiginitomaculum sp.]|nr:VOC family protein [Robiginitomaculum sp.]